MAMLQLLPGSSQHHPTEASVGLRRDASVCRDLGTSVNHVKNQLPNCQEKSQPGQPGSHRRDVGIPAGRAQNLPCVRYRFRPALLAGSTKVHITKFRFRKKMAHQKVDFIRPYKGRHTRRD